MSSLGLNIRIPKDSLIKLSHHQNQQLVVRFNGGRQIHGKLKSWDKTMNLILDNTAEVVGVDQKEKQQIKRELGLVIVKGSQIQSIALKGGFVLVDNPYANLGQEGEGKEEENQEDGQQNEGEIDGEQENIKEKQQQQ